MPRPSEPGPTVAAGAGPTSGDAAGAPPGAGDDAAACEVVTPLGPLCPEANVDPRVDPRHRSSLDRLMRQLLVIDDAAPRALFELKGSLVLSAVRCVLTYAIVPLVVPVIGWAGVLATPLSLVLSLVAVVLAVTSLRRVWMADYRHRWAYTAFIAAAVGLLTAVIVSDVRTLLG